MCEKCLAPQKPSGIMTVAEVAQYLQVSESWVYKNQKMLGGKRLGGILRFRKETLDGRLQA